MQTQHPRLKYTLLVASLVLLLLDTHKAGAQGNAKYCNMIANPTLTWSGPTPPGPGLDPFSIGQVAGWRSVSVTPQANVNAFISAPNSAQMWSHIWTGFPSGEAAGQRIARPLEVGKNYSLSIRARKMPSPGRGNVVVEFYHSNTVPGLGNTWLMNLISQPHQTPISRSITSTIFFSNIEVCFTADDDYDFIVIRPDPNTNPGTDYWLWMDNVALYESIAITGPDNVCTGMPSVTLGVPRCPPLLNVRETFEWRMIRNAAGMPVNIFMGQNPQLVVQPNGCTEYRLTRRIGSCVSSQTVKAHQGNPPQPNIGDTIFFCRPNCVTLYGPVGIGLTYLWSTGQTSQNITVCDPGKYWLRVTQGCCSKTDTVIVKLRPDFKLSPKDTIICTSALPFTICADAGFATYQWLGGGNGRCTTVNAAGSYIITVTDVNGCQKTDTATLMVVPVVPFDLGANDTICEGDTVTYCGPGGNYTYNWTGGNTTRCKKIWATGTYYLTATNIHGCVYTDSVKVLVVPFPTITLPSYGPYCRNQGPVNLTASPPNGTWMGTGVNGNTFSPIVAGEGTHTLTYSLTVPPSCTSIASITITVNPTPKVSVDRKGTVCKNAPPFTLVGHPANGIFSGGAYLTSAGVFNPATAGVGRHKVKYTVTDSTSGCTDSFVYGITVVSPPKAFIAIQGDTMSPCKGSIITLTGTATEAPGEPVTPAGSYETYWQHDGEQSVSTVSKSGTYWFVAQTSDGVCKDSQKVTLNFINCCFVGGPITNNPIINTNTTWTDTAIILEGTLKVTNLAKLTLTRVQMYMKPCAKIEVHRGADLEIYSSHLGLCDTGWQGIEVWGQIDQCPEDYANQGKLIMVDDTLDHADIGIFVGARTGPPGTTDPKLYGNATIDVQQSVFQDNYVDIMWSEANVAGACTDCAAIPPNPSPPVWLSKVWNNHFLLPDTLEHCDSFASVAIRDYSAAFPIAWGSPQPGKCHIVDLNLVPNVWSWTLCPPGGSLGSPTNPATGCGCYRFDDISPGGAGLNEDKTIFSKGYSPLGIPVDIFQGNIFTSPCSSPRNPN